MLNFIKKPIQSTVILVAAILTLIVTLGSFYVVDETERGVLLRNGALVGVVEPGLSFKVPLIDTVKFISVQNQTVAYKGVQAYSRDQQTATLNVSVSFHVEPGATTEVYTKYKDLDGMVTRLISRHVPTQVENVFGQYNAVSAVQKRAELTADISRAIKESIDGPVVIDGVQVENIDFSDDYEKSIAERMKAEVAVKTREQMLETEKVQAQIRVTQAQADADAKLAQAKADAEATRLRGDAEATRLRGDAEATRLRGDAEADAIRAKASALASNQNLVELTKAERWDGVLPITMLPNSAVPFIGK